MNRAKLALVLIFAAIGAGLLTAQQPPAEDFSGAYSFLRDGEFVQINVQNGKLDGWVSRFGESDSDKGATIDQFFDKTSLDGDRVSFTTKTIHGVRYEFTGTVARGPAKTRAQDGYFVLRGTLTQYTTDADRKETARQREVEFKLLPIDVDTAADHRKSD